MDSMSVCDHVLSIPLPQYLQEHKEQILHIFDNASGWDYNAKMWQQHFAHDTVVTNDLNKIVKKCPTRISRSDVRYFATKACSGGYEELRTLFLACMIWGWGRGGKYQRGFKNTEAALSDSRLEGLLKKSVEEINNARIEQAYNGFKLDGCGSAFFTKFFYFVGQGYGVNPLPLIRDAHVTNFLRFLSKQEEWGSSVCASILEEKEKGYIQYICSVDNWRKNLSCSADNIEYFMFKKGRKLREHVTGKTGRQNTLGVEGMNKRWKGGEMEDSILQVPLPAEAIKWLETLAQKDGEEATSLAGKWIMEKLHELTNRHNLLSASSLAITTQRTPGSLPTSFQGTITDERNKDKAGWLRRSIGVLKNQSGGYPQPGDEITVIDTNSNRYRLKFTKSRKRQKVCLGQPGILKPWYVKHYPSDAVRADNVYFQYTGHIDEYRIYSSEELKKIPKL